MRPIVRTLHVALALAAVGSLNGCRRATNAGDGGGAALMTNLMRARALDVVVEERELVEPLARAAARLSRVDETHRFAAAVRASSTDARIPRVVVGTPASAAARALAERAGIQMLAAAARASDAAAPRTGGFRYGTQEFGDRRDALVATFEDPERPGLPVTLVLANDPNVAAIAAGEIAPGWKPWIRILRSGDVVLSGPLDTDGSPRLSELARVGFSRATMDRELAPIADPKPGVVGSASRDLDPAFVSEYSWACVHARERAVGWCAPETGIPSADVVLWSNVSGYVAHGDPDQLWRFDPVDERVDALLVRRDDGVHGDGTRGDGVRGDGARVGGARGLDDGGAGVACAGIWNRVGPPVAPWMSAAAAVEAAWWWWGSDLDAWLARIASADLDLTPARLVDDATTGVVSSHVLVPRRAALWRFLRESRGDAFVRELWRGTRALDLDAPTVTAFGAWTNAHVERGLATLRADRLARQQDVARLPTLRGVGTCEPEPDGVRASRSGYGSAAFRRTLDEAAELGADAVSVNAFTRDVSGAPASFDDPRARALTAREGDVRVVAALLAGDEHGMRTMLVPHLLAGDGGTWSGTWTRSDREEWRAFFERYARFVEHHALLAQIGGAEILSIGSGQWAVTGGEPEGRRANPEEPGWRAEGWARVIGAARGVFDGRLVYSAGSPDELARVPFFGDLDLVGLEFAPTLDHDVPWDAADARDAVGRSLETALMELQRVSRASGKRALITQASFSPDLHGPARVLGAGTASSAWQAAQVRELSSRLDAWRSRIDLAGVFAWRLGDATVAGDHDSRIEAPEVRGAVRELLSKQR